MSHKKFDRKIKWLIVFVLIFLMLIPTTLLLLVYLNPPMPSPRKIANIALYSGRGTWDKSVQAAMKMFEWMNYTVELVDSNLINSKGLDGFRVLCVPGGNMYDYAKDISSVGKQNIKNFILNGGGYIGICGGAYFASRKVIWQGGQLPMAPLAIFQGTSTGPIDAIVSYPDYAMCKINIVNHTHPTIFSEPDSEWMLYYWGPALTPDSGANVTILARYENENLPAVVAFSYGQGRVYLIGTHPEIEEDSERDGVLFADEFDDNGSDWKLMRKAVSWIITK